MIKKILLIALCLVPVLFYGQERGIPIMSGFVIGSKNPTNVNDTCLTVAGLSLKTNVASGHLTFVIEDSSYYSYVNGAYKLLETGGADSTLFATKYDLTQLPEPDLSLSDSTVVFVTPPQLMDSLANFVNPVSVDSIRSLYKGVAITSMSPASPENGDWWRCGEAGEYTAFDEVTASIGDILAYSTGNGWELIESSDLSEYLQKDSINSYIQEYLTTGENDEIAIDSIYKLMVQDLIFADNQKTYIAQSIDSLETAIENDSVFNYDYGDYYEYSITNGIEQRIIKIPGSTNEIYIRPEQPRYFPNDKKGGLQLRIDDPFTYTTPYGEQFYLSFYTTLYLAEKYNVNITWAAPVFYTGTEVFGDVFTMPEAKRKGLQIAASLGHDIASHSINHNTNFFYVPIAYIDAIDTTDWTASFDTIYINNSLTADTIRFWKTLEDDHYSLRANTQSIDPDSEADSIWYGNIPVPAKTGMFAIKPNVRGLNKMLKYNVKAFRANGLPDPVTFIHPGQTHFNDPEILDNKKSYGSINTALGGDTVIYTVTTSLCSYPLLTPQNISSNLNCGTNLYFDDDNNFKIESIIGSNGTDTDTILLTSFSSHALDDGEVHTDGYIGYISEWAENWMWQIHPDTLEAAGKEFGIRYGAVYLNGLEGIGAGSVPGYDANYRYSAQWFTSEYKGAGGDYANKVMTEISNLTALNRVSGFDTHAGFTSTYNVDTINSAGYLRDYYRIDSILDFCGRENIKVGSMPEIFTNVFDLPKNKYESAIPSFNTDLDGNGIPDGVTVTGTPTKNTIDTLGMTCSYTLTNGNYIAYNILFGVEKGLNNLSFYAKDNSGSGNFTIEVKEYEHEEAYSNGTSASVILARTTNYTITLTGGGVWEAVNQVVTIGNNVDYISIKFSVASSRNIELTNINLSK